MKSIDDVIKYIDSILEYDKPGNIPPIPPSMFIMGYLQAFRDIRGSLVEENEEIEEK